MEVSGVQYRQLWGYEVYSIGKCGGVRLTVQVTVGFQVYSTGNCGGAMCTVQVPMGMSGKQYR